MDNPLSDTQLNDFVLSQMPHFIAVNYQRLLTAQTPQEKVELAFRTYNLGLRALTLGLVSQYLIRDDDRVSDPYLNELLLQKFPRLTLDAWQQLLFAALRAYEGKRALFFMPELYDFYWDDPTAPSRQRVEVEAPFNRLTQLALEHKTEKLLPQTEADWTQLAAETKSLLTQILNYLAFIGRYDLIRVLGYDEHFYQCERHKGLTTSIEESQPRPGHIELIEGWFYLRREVADFLLLHPLLIGQRSTFFIRDNIILGSPVLRTKFIQILANAADCKNARQWLNYALREIINLIYGGEVLRPAK